MATREPNTETDLPEQRGVEEVLKLSRNPIQINVLEKAFTVLEVLAEFQEPIPLKDIAAASKLPKATLYRILQTLCSLGYVNQIDGTSYYYMTSQIAYLGRNARYENIKILASPLMRALHAKFNETINLGILEGVFIYYVEVLEADRALAWKVPSGSRDLFFSTALGRAIAAYVSPVRREMLIQQANLSRRTSKTVTNKASLTSVLEDVAHSGVAYDFEENDEGVVCIGAPLFLDGEVVASVSVSIPASRYTPFLGEEIKSFLLSQDRQFRTNRTRSSSRTIA